MPVEVMRVTGFDPDGEPEIRREADGSLRLVFNFMPPSWAPDEDEDLGFCEDLDKELARAVGVPVVWEDREIFYVEKPREDTVEQIKAFLSEFSKRHGAPGE